MVSVTKESTLGLACHCCYQKQGQHAVPVVDSCTIIPLFDAIRSA